MVRLALSIFVYMSQTLDRLERFVRAQERPPDLAKKIRRDSIKSVGTGRMGYGENVHGHQVGWWLNVNRYRAELAAVLPYLKLEGEKQGLGLGTGTALHEQAIAASYPHIKITAVDGSNEEVETGEAIARQNEVSNIEFKLSQVSELGANLPDDFFDFAVSFAFLHDVEDLDSAALNIARTLKQGGVFASTFIPGRRRALYPTDTDVAIHFTPYFDVVESKVAFSGDAMDREYLGKVREGGSRFSHVQSLILKKR